MDLLQEQPKIGGNKTFLGHVFSSAEEDKAEIFNVLQYAIYALIPIVILNKLIQRFIPEADPDKSSLEILLEIAIQVVVIFAGIIIIHRIVTYFPTYSGFKYDNLTLTNAILAFLMIVLNTVVLEDIFSGLTKATLFGVVVASVGCLRGMQTGTGAAAVGISTTRAVVSSIVMITIVDGIFAYVSYRTGF